MQLPLFFKHLSKHFFHNATVALKILVVFLPWIFLFSGSTAGVHWLVLVAAYLWPLYSYAIIFRKEVFAKL
jgi:hypothetical protein